MDISQILLCGWSAICPTRIIPPHTSFFQKARHADRVGATESAFGAHDNRCVTFGWHVAFGVFVPLPLSLFSKNSPSLA